MTEVISEYLEDLKTSRRRAGGSTYGKNVISYSKLPTSDPGNNGFIDAQFQTPPVQKIPWKSIILACLLLIAGTAMIIFGILASIGQIKMHHSNKMWPMIVLGVLMFIPGAYHIRIAVMAYKQVPGYSFDDIPEFE